MPAYNIHPLALSPTHWALERAGFLVPPLSTKFEGFGFLPDTLNIDIELSEGRLYVERDIISDNLEIVFDLSAGVLDTTTYLDFFMGGAYVTPPGDVLAFSLGIDIIENIDYLSDDLSAQITTYTLFAICTKDNYTYAASNAGLVVYDNTSMLRVATRNVGDNLPKCIYCTDTLLYVGTENGLYYIVLEEFINDFNGCTINRSYITLFNNIKHIHGSDEDLLITTTSGIEYFNFSGNPNIISKTDTIEVEKSFLADKKGYYITRDPVAENIKYSLNRIDSMLCDWAKPTHSYVTGSGIFEEGIKLTDMYITEGTAINGNNTIFCATSSGIYVIDEDSQEYALYYTR